MTTRSITLDALAARIDAVLAREHQWPEWMSVETAARYSDLSVASIRRLLSGGRLVGRRVVKGRVLISRTELDSLIRAATTTPRTGRGRATARGT